jgi:hypothetical protein
MLGVFEKAVKKALSGTLTREEVYKRREERKKIHKELSNLLNSISATPQNNQTHQCNEEGSEINYIDTDIFCNLHHNIEYTKES